MILLQGDGPAPRYVKSDAWRWLAVWAVSAMICVTLLCLGFTYLTVEKYNCMKSSCDWVPAWDESECDVETCHIYWMVVVKNVSRGLLWGDMDYDEYESNSTLYPPYPNDTVCYKSVECTSSMYISDWWTGAGPCQPVFNCFEGDARNTKGSIGMLWATGLSIIGLCAALLVWVNFYACGPRDMAYDAV